MNSNEIIGTLFVLLSYYLIVRVIIKNPEGVSFSSFVLWAILDCITAIMIYLKDGAWFLPALFTVCSLYVAILLYRMNQKTWSNHDWKVSALIFICIVFWFGAGEVNGTIAATIAVVLAGIPQLRTNLKKPERETLPAWISFTAGNLFFYMASNATLYEEFVSERLCPLGNGLMSCAMMIVIALRK